MRVAPSTLKSAAALGNAAANLSEAYQGNQTMQSAGAAGPAAMNPQLAQQLGYAPPGNDAYLWGGQTGYTGVYAQVESGPPIIMNPETGQPYPPGFVPTVQNPYTHDLYQPFEKMQEARQLAQAESAYAWNKAMENVLGPIDERMANAHLDKNRQANQQLLSESEKMGADPAGYIQGKLGALMPGAAAASGPSGGKPAANSGAALTPAKPQTAKEAGMSAGYALNNFRDRAKAGIRSGIRNTFDYLGGFAEATGIVSSPPRSRGGHIRVGQAPDIAPNAGTSNATGLAPSPPRSWGGHVRVNQSPAASPDAGTGIRRSGGLSIPRQ